MIQNGCQSFPLTVGDGDLTIATVRGYLVGVILTTDAAASTLVVEDDNGDLLTAIGQANTTIPIMPPQPIRFSGTLHATITGSDAVAYLLVRK